MNFEIIVSKLGGKGNLLYIPSEKQLYVKRYDTKRGLAYNCYVNYKNKAGNACPSKILVTGETATHSGKAHNHPNNQEVLYKTFSLKNSLKKRFSTESTSLRRIFVEQTSLAVFQKSAQNVQLYSVRSAMYKARTIPANPKSPIDFASKMELPEIKEKYGMTVDEENPSEFFKTTIRSVSGGISVVFVSEQIIQQIKDIDEDVWIFADGTFSHMPNFFHQLYILSVAVRGCIFPFALVLMTNRLSESYSDVFSFLKNTYGVNPKFFMSDWEKAARKAASQTWPEAAIKGCWFHYCQALRRNAKADTNLGPTISKKSGELTNPEHRSLFQSFLNLPLLNPTDIPTAFLHLKMLVETRFPLFLNFLSYFERQWMLNIGADKLSVNFLAHRTNNPSESYNSVLKRFLGSSNTNSWSFLDDLRKEEFFQRTGFLQVLNGATHVRAKPKNREVLKNMRIRSLQDARSKNIISVIEFITSGLDQIIFSSDEESSDLDLVNSDMQPEASQISNQGKRWVLMERKHEDNLESSDSRIRKLLGLENIQICLNCRVELAVPVLVYPCMHDPSLCLSCRNLNKCKDCTKCFKKIDMFITVT